MEWKSCPISFATDPVAPLRSCLEKNCGWWDEKHHRCGILTIAKTLATIAFHYSVFQEGRGDHK